MTPPINLPIGTLLKSRVVGIGYRVVGDPLQDPKQEWVWPCVIDPDGKIVCNISLQEITERMEVVG